MPSQQLIWVALTALVGIPFNAAFFTYTSVVHELARTREPPLTSAAGRQRVLDAARDKLEAKLWPTVLASFQVWPFANCVMYYGVSLPYRQLFGSGVGLLWNVWLSGQAALARPEGPGDAG